MSQQTGVGPRGGVNAVVAIAALGAGLATTGIQGIAPALPAIQQQFDLNDGQVALISSVYLFPSIFSAFLGGALADRFGTRKVFTFALLVFGAGALVLLVVHSLPLLLGVRFVQGIAFGTILGLSISLIGSVLPSGAPAARGQARRIVSMAVAEAIFPVVTGLLLAISWYAPFAIQLLAVPLAVASWLLLPDVRPARGVGAPSMVRTVVAVRGFVSLQSLGVLRFVVKFAVITYFPILAVNELGMSPVLVGITLGLSATLSAISAWFSERLALRWSAARLVAGSVVLASLSVAVIGVVPSAGAAIAAMLIFGLQDGVTGVAQNVLVVELAPASARSAFSGATVTLRNVGKFTAPILFAAATLALPVSASFVALAGVGAIALFATFRVERVQREAAKSGDAESTESPSPEGDGADVGAEPGEGSVK